MKFEFWVRRERTPFYAQPILLKKKCVYTQTHGILYSIYESEVEQKKNMAVNVIETINVKYVVHINLSIIIWLTLSGNAIWRINLKIQNFVVHTSKMDFVEIIIWNLMANQCEANLKRLRIQKNQIFCVDATLTHGIRFVEIVNSCKIALPYFEQIHVRRRLAIVIFNSIVPTRV